MSDDMNYRPYLCRPPMTTPPSSYQPLSTSVGFYISGSHRQAHGAPPMRRRQSAEHILEFLQIETTIDDNIISLLYFWHFELFMKAAIGDEIDAATRNHHEWSIDGAIRSWNALACDFTRHSLIYYEVISYMRQFIAYATKNTPSIENRCTVGERLISYYVDETGRYFVYTAVAISYSA